MRLILMGTGPFAVPSFEAIRSEQQHEILHVVTRPIAAGLNTKEPIRSPVREWALQNELPLSDPDSINDPATIEWLKSQQADLMVVCDYGQILSKSALQATRLGGINLHGSLLPRHRGAAPVQWSILAGDSVSGVSVIHMTPALDGGPILSRAELRIDPGENAQQLEDRLSALGVQPTLHALQVLSHCEQLSDCVGLGEIQNQSLATKAPRLSKSDGQLQFQFRAQQLDRLVRGLQPWPGTFAHLQFPDGKSLRILIPRVFPIESNYRMEGSMTGELVYGKRLQHAKENEPQLREHDLAVIVADGFLALPMLQPAGKRMMDALEFLRGYARYPSMSFVSDTSENTLLHHIRQLDSRR